MIRIDRVSASVEKGISLESELDKVSMYSADGIGSVSSIGCSLAWLSSKVVC